MAKKSTTGERPEALVWGFRFLAFIAICVLEFVVSSFTKDKAMNDVWGWALVYVSVAFAIVATFGLLVVTYVWRRGQQLSALLPLVVVLGCLAWGWWQLSGALGAGMEKHRAEAVQATEEWRFANERLSVANATIKALDEEAKAIDVRAIVQSAQADLDADKASRDANRRRLKGERGSLFTFVSSADPAEKADAIAAAQRRMRGIDAELAQLLDAETVAEPFKAVEVEIEARKAGIASRRAQAEKDRALYLPTVQKGEQAKTITRSLEDMLIAALILALVTAMGSAFDLPARTGAETKRRNQKADATSGGTIIPIPWPLKKTAA